MYMFATASAAAPAVVDAAAAGGTDSAERTAGV